ncbi:unnamed protein product [Acanthoscelides obtectus]|uniref:Uncharacterized protein n=1 Tax=Acanthoscelides obtectus TaxID=200917 RepID=A0A9P0K910_ACAOB|nr:unnamed protein product [Acanthoscelides obtectus]CAK1632582.1 hypothetical protein AOBTE_LOCUS7630 [Acanthoscelides obtectus]
MSVICHLSITEVIKTEWKIQNKIRIHLHKILIYILCNRYTYTVGGLFRINGVIVLKMLHFVTSFVIILIQFQEAITPSFDCDYRTT